MIAAIEAARRRAREAAAEQAAIEVAALAKDWQAEIVAPPREDQRQEDIAAAESSGAAYASAWMALALYALSKWTANGSKGSIASQIASVTTQIDYRVRRIVTTETARAHSDEHRGIVRRIPRGPWSSKTFRRWDARLDRRVCSVCRAHDAEETPIGETFRLGHEPGDVHPGCRCIAVVVTFPNAERIDVTREAA